MPANGRWDLIRRLKVNISCCQLGLSFNHSLNGIQNAGYRLYQKYFSTQETSLQNATCSLKGSLYSVDAYGMHTYFF